MAPANGSSKSRKAQPSQAKAAQQQQQQQPKPPSTKPVVPALPLSYAKRKSQAAADDAPPADQPKKHDGQNESLKKSEKPASTSTSSREAVAAAATAKATPAPTTQHRKPATETTSPAVKQAPPKDQDHPAPQVVGADAAADNQTPKNHAAVAVETKPVEKTQAKDNSARPKPRSSMSPVRYQMPPPFHPANRPPHFHNNGDIPRGPPEPMHNGHRHGHQPHLSNSSVHFGTFHGSQTSSPAPLSGGSVAPPPGIGMPDGHQPYMGPGPNGFPPVMPFGGDMMPVPGFDNFGRPSVGFPPMDSYPPYRGGFGPSGPHSFHGSQSSNAEDMAMYNHFPRGPPPAGPGSNPEDARTSNGNGTMFGFPGMARNDGVVRQSGEQDNAMELANYISMQFGNPQFADCTLELRYLDDRAVPVRIPGHRIIFSRNPRLAALIHSQTLPPSPNGTTAQTLLLETDSKWIRSDSFYMAAQHLYGLPILPRFKASEAEQLSDAGTNADKLDFALAYAAAGHLLQSEAVLRRGCEVAADLINWQTIERVLEFALEKFVDHGLHDNYQYGIGSKLLLDAVAIFIVHNFPPTFELDAFVTEPIQFARLPVRLPAVPRPAVEEEKPASDDAASPVQFGRGKRSQKITNIQFGDLAVSEPKPGSESETPRASKQAQPVSHAILSRILLNIPFTHLKMIMESSGSGNVRGWANAEARYKIVKSAIEERESLRHRALQTVLDDKVPNSGVIVSKLRSPEPQAGDEWSVLGWVEEMLPYGNMDGPSLGRKWVPVSVSQNGGSGYPVADYP